MCDSSANVTVEMERDKLASGEESKATKHSIAFSCNKSCCFTLPVYNCLSCSTEPAPHMQPATESGLTGTLQK